MTKKKTKKTNLVGRPAIRSRDRLSHRLVVLFKPDEIEKLSREAARQKATVSQVVRSVLQEANFGRRKRKR